MLADTTVIYYNGKRFKLRRRRHDSMWADERTRLHTLITFAYRGIPDEWPVIISYVIR